MNKIIIAILSVLLLTSCAPKVIIGDNLNSLLRDYEKSQIYIEAYKKGVVDGIRSGYGIGYDDGYKDGYKKGIGIVL